MSKSVPIKNKELYCFIFMHIKLNASVFSGNGQIQISAHTDK